MGQLGYTASQTGHCAGWADEESRLGEGEEKMDLIGITGHMLRR